MGQFLGTKNYGVIEVESSFPVASKFDGEGNIIQQGGHIALLANGAYCHVTGLPIASEEEIVAVFTTADGKVIKGSEQVLKDALEWFRHRHENEQAPLPRIMFDHQGWPFFETGAPVEKEEDLYQCLKAGPVLTAAIVGLHERRKFLAEEAAKMPETHETMPEPNRVAGDPSHVAVPVNPTTVNVKAQAKAKTKPMTHGARKYAKPKARSKATATV